MTYSLIFVFCVLGNCYGFAVDTNQTTEDCQHAISAAPAMLVCE